MTDEDISTSRSAEVASSEVASSSFEIIPSKLKTHALERDLPSAY